MHELSVRFRGIRALYGEEGFKKLQNAHVMVIGCGGVGSWITEALCRSGVGTLTLIDPDTVEIGNTNRQLHTTDLTINQYKVRALKNRLITINPEIKIHTLEITLTKENIPEILKDCPQFIADAIDDLLTIQNRRIRQVLPQWALLDNVDQLFGIRLERAGRDAAELCLQIPHCPPGRVLRHLGRAALELRATVKELGVKVAVVAPCGVA